MAKERCCKTCVHSQWNLSPTGRIKKDVLGWCQYVIELPIMPSCVQHPLSIHKYRISPNDNATCPVWTENTSSLNGV